VQTRYVSANYLSALGVAAILGWDFLPEEERQGGPPAVILSYLYWQRLGSDPTLVGEYVNLSGIRCQVVGVAPEGFTGVELVGADLWLPLGSYLAVAGFIVGLLLGLGVAKVSASMLYGVSPVDLVSIVVTVALLGVTSLLTSYVPARQAARVDPMVALRSE
jgi:hypothetical protein